MLTFIVHGETHQISAHRFSELVAVAVRLMKDASQGTGVDFDLAGLHASAPTIQWQPVTTDEPVDVDMQFVRIVERLDVGIGLLESQAEVPDWMNESTARRLHEVAKWFGESEVDGVTFLAGRVKRRLTRETYLTLDRWLHEEHRVTASEASRLYRSGPPVVNWLREQRDG